MINFYLSSISFNKLNYVAYQLIFNHRSGVHRPGGWGGLPPVRDPQPQQQDSVLAEGAGPPHPHRGQGDLHL